MKNMELSGRNDAPACYGTGASNCDCIFQESCQYYSSAPSAEPPLLSGAVCIDEYIDRLTSHLDFKNKGYSDQIPVDRILQVLRTLSTVDRYTLQLLAFCIQDPAFSVGRIAMRRNVSRQAVDEKIRRSVLQYTFLSGVFSSGYRYLFRPGIFSRKKRR